MLTELGVTGLGAIGRLALIMSSCGVGGAMIGALAARMLGRKSKAVREACFSLCSLAGLSLGVYLSMQKLITP